MISILWIVIFLAAMMVLAYQRASLPVWSIGIFIILLLFVGFVHPSWLTISLLAIFYILIFGILNIHFLRRLLISQFIFKIYKNLMPTMSETEEAALESGTVGWEGDLFSGMPDWERLQNMSLAQLTDEERLFMEGPVEEVCRLIDQWQISREMQIPESIWTLLKSAGFFGMIIPKEYGGLGFTPFGHAQVIYKLASASTAVGTVASVPNSLGPGELLLRYGTDEQKNYYLPRLASGQDIPCFALTSPVAGSDAGSITDTGIICRHHFEGEEQLCLRLNWNKRYITLSPVATLIGLAFKCYDPENLLGEKKSLGITCALVPAHLNGVTKGRRHFPLHSAFPNGPTQGKDVIIPLKWVIGGEQMIGQGWQMLMECLAAGRSISLPSMVGANANRCLLATGAYVKIRRQFNTAIANFEGLQEVIARMTGYTYQVNALRRLTLSILNQGETPAVASAISKYHATELSRQVINDAMDVQGGKGICMGPCNYLAQSYIEAPIGITVEGANILTRSLMIYGQGALRCHPYLYAEMKAAHCEKETQGLLAFDRALFAHIGFIISNKVRSFVLGMSQGRFADAPDSPLKRYYQLLTRFSAVLAWLSDMTTLILGAQLKRREMLSARLGDVLSLLYIGSAVLKDYEYRQITEEQCIVEWVLSDLLYRVQTQIDALISNLPNVFYRFSLRCVIFPRGKNLKSPSDVLTRKVAALISQTGKVRESFSEALYYTSNDNNPVAYMESVLQQVIRVEPIEAKIAKVYRKGLMQGDSIEAIAESAVAANIITVEESKQWLAAYRASLDVIQVDDFAEI